jgi:hypothetical protein
LTATVTRLPTRDERIARAAAPHADSLVERMAARRCSFAVLSVFACGHASGWPRASLESTAEAGAALAPQLGMRSPLPEPPPGVCVLVITEREAGWLTLEQLARAT